MSVNKLISIKVPVFNAMEDLAIDHDKLIPLFTRWALDAEKKIGSKFQYVTKKEVLKIDNCVACLPADAAFVDIAVFGDYSHECGDLMSRAYNWTTGRVVTGTPSFLIVDVGQDGFTFTGYIDYTIQNNKMIFDQNYDGQCITIQYVAPVKDCDGFDMVGENHVIAITEYIKWKYFYRKNGINSMEYGKMNLAKEQWNQECLAARALDGEITENERVEIVHGIIHNPYIGISLNAGMRTTLDNGYWYY
jgi:hypothetical protein